MALPNRTTTSRRAFLAGTASVLALDALPASADGPADFKIGVIGSLSGPAAAYSREYVEGLLAYVKAWNQRGGVKGRKIVAEVLDDGTDAANAVTAFRREATDPATMVIWAALGSQTALALKAISGAPESRMALINNQTLMVGESGKVRVRDTRVEVVCKEIREDSVLITVDGKPCELKLGVKSAATAQK